MACAHDPRRSVNICAHVSLAGHERLTGVNAHAYANRPAGERILTLAGRGDRVAGARECVEEPVSRRVHLDSAASRERVAQHAAVLGQDVGVRIAQFLE